MRLRFLTLDNREATPLIPATRIRLGRPKICPMTLALATLAYGITVVALVLLAVRVRKLIGIYKKGQPDPTRSGDRGARLKNMLSEVLGHTKMLNFTATGIAHWFVMIGFGALFGTLVQAYFLITDQRWALPGIGHFSSSSCF